MHAKDSSTDHDDDARGRLNRLSPETAHESAARIRPNAPIVSDMLITETIQKPAGQRRGNAAFPCGHWLLAAVLLIWLQLGHICRAIESTQVPGPQPAARQDEELRSERRRLQKASEQSWANRDLATAVRQTEQLASIEAKLFGDDAELLTERFRRLSDLHLEAGNQPAAEAARDRVLRLLKVHAVDGSWHEFEATSFLRYFEQLSSLQQSDRLGFYDSQRFLHQSLEQSDYAAALEAAEEVAAIVTQHLGTRHPMWVEVMFNITYLQIAMGTLDTAEVQLQQLQNEVNQFVPPQHYDFAILHWLKSYLKTSQGDAAAADRESSRAIELFEQSDTLWHPLYAQALRLKSYVALVTGQHQNAIGPLRKAYELSRGMSLSKDAQDDNVCADLCTALQVSATLKMESQESESALDLSQEALQLAMDRWGNDDYRTVNIRHQAMLCREAVNWSNTEFQKYSELIAQENKADSLLQQNQFAGSYDAALIAYEGFQRLLGAEHPRALLNRKRTLAAVLRPGTISAEQHEDFKQMVSEFTESLTKEFGSSHPVVADLWYRFSYFVGADDPDRIRFARNAVEAYRQSLTVESDEYVIALTRLGRWLCHAESAEAEDVLKQAVQLWNSRASRNSYQHGVAAYWLGYFYYYVADQPYEAAGRIRDAVEVFDQVPEQLAGLEPALALNLLGNVYSDRGSYDEALFHYRKAIQLFEQHQPIERTGEEGTYRWLLYNTARSCFEQQKLSEAETLLKKMRERFSDGPASREMAYLHGCFALARVYMQLHRLEEAESVLAEAGYAIDLHYRTQPDSDSRTFRALHSIHAARLAIAQQNEGAARTHLDKAWSEYEAMAADPESLSPFELDGLTVSIDRLIEVYEQIDAWQEIVEIRRVLVPLCRISLQESWPHLFQIEEERLQIAERLAKADPAARSSFRRMREHTETLQRRLVAGHSVQEQRSDSHGQTDVVDVRAKDVQQRLNTVSETLGRWNLPAAEYAQQVAKVFAEQEQLSQAALFQREATAALLMRLGQTHPRTAEAQVVLAGILRRMGQYVEAEHLLTSAVATLTDIQGEYNVDTILAQLESARLHAEVEDFAAALPLARAASDSFGHVWGRHNVTYGESQQVLADIYLGLNEQTLAAQHIEAAGRIFERLLPTQDRRRLRNAAQAAFLMALSRSSPQETEAAFIAAIDGYRLAKREARTDYIELLVHFGDFLVEQEQPEQAADVFEQALEARRAAPRPRHDVLEAAVLVRSATVRRINGDAATALSQLRTALQIQETVFGRESTAVSETLHQLAMCNEQLDDPDAARRAIVRSLDIQQAELRQVGNLLSEQSLQEMLGGTERRLDLLLRQHRETVRQGDASQSQTDAETGFYWTLQRKGLALDLACRQRAMRQQSLHDSEAVRVAERLRLLNQELADLALLRPEAMSPDELARKRDRLTTEVAALNNQLALRLATGSSGTAQPEQELTQVQQALDDRTVFVEFVRVAGRPKNATEFASDDSQDDSYIAFVLSGSDSSVQFFDLGSAAEVDRLVEELRELTRRFPRSLRVSSEDQLEADYRAVARRLFDRVLGFLPPLLEDQTRLVIGPDSALATLPFSALVDSGNRYLVEVAEISYVSSARDLLRNPAEAGRGTVILSNPNFDADRQLIEQSLEQLQQVQTDEAVIAMRGTSAGLDENETLRSLRWRSLPGAELEAADVRSILTDSDYGPVNSYLGNDAVEEVLKAIRTPRLLHLATHGFYVPLQQDEFASGRSRSPRSLGAGLARLRTDRNPLLRSGIVLAGANRLNRSAVESEAVASETPVHVLEDGWVTAQEIAGMNLRHTELVVLSACESGLGDVSVGQGVYGLRRAFMHAGAHALLTSLFEVPDTETRELMKSFYQHLHRTGNRRTALNEAQRQRIRERRSDSGAAHPFYWASFILLDGTQQK